jgi:hypothetical protein
MWRAGPGDGSPPGPALLSVLLRGQAGALGQGQGEDRGGGGLPEDLGHGPRQRLGAVVVAVVTCRAEGLVEGLQGGVQVVLPVEEDGADVAEREPERVVLLPGDLPGDEVGGLTVQWFHGSLLFSGPGRGTTAPQAWHSWSAVGDDFAG